MLRQIPVLAFALITSASAAQVRFGLKAGPTYTTFVDKYAPEIQPGNTVQDYALMMGGQYQGNGLPVGTISMTTENATGWGFGVGGYMDAHACGVLDVRLELLYSNRSITGDYMTAADVQQIGEETNAIIYQATDASGTFHQDLNYLEVPLLVGLRIPQGPRLLGGIGGAFLVGGRTNYRGESNSITWRQVYYQGATYPQELSETSTNTDFSYVGKEATRGLNSVEWAGILGVEFPFGENFCLGFRYWHGLSSVHVSTAYPDESTHTSHNQVFHCTLGISLSPSTKHVPAAPGG